MKTGTGQFVKELVEQFDGISVRDNKEKKLNFRMYMTQAMKDTPIDSLELSQRSYHCLKRAGYDTIGELTSAISSGVSLRRVRNCGTKSVREIQERLFVFQYFSLSAEERVDFIKEVIAINVIHALADKP